MKNSCVQINLFTDRRCSSFPTAGFIKLVTIFDLRHRFSSLLLCFFVPTENEYRYTFRYRLAQYE